MLKPKPIPKSTINYAHRLNNNYHLCLAVLDMMTHLDKSAHHICNFRIIPICYHTFRSTVDAIPTLLEQYIKIDANINHAGVRPQLIKE